MADFLDAFILDLLHIDDVKDNKLIDLGSLNGNVGINSNKNGETFVLSANYGSDSASMLRTIKRRIGKLSNNTVLSDSALNVTSVVNPNVEKWDWHDLNGVKEAAKLNDFITGVYSEISSKGNNPLFLGVGVLKWKIAVADRLETVNSPILIFPIRLVRGTGTSLVEIEFIDDDAYFNPCLIAKLRRDYNEYFSNSFPHPNGSGADFDEPISLDKLGDGTEYFQKVRDFVDALGGDKGDGFELYDNCVVISQYMHDDLSMYYDVKRNMDLIYSHPLVARVFGQKAEQQKPAASNAEVRLILPADSVQQKLIGRVVAGESMIIKGPPGTGKTVTIANMIAALIANGKRVLLSSKKLAALSEVHAKLPEELRKFTMLLDAETEKKASKINPDGIRKDLRELLQYRREYKYDVSYSTKNDAERRKKARAVQDLEKYFAIMHTPSFVGRSYYETLDSYFANKGKPVVSFASPARAAAVSASDFELLKDDVKIAAKHLEAMSDGVGVAARSAWYGVGAPEDVAAVLKDAEDIVAVIDKISELLEPAIEEYADLELDLLTVAELINIVGNNAFDRQDMAKLMRAEELACSIEQLIELISDRKNSQCEAEALFKFNLLPSESSLSAIDAVNWDVELGIKQLERVYANLGLLEGADGKPLDGVTLSKMSEAAKTLFEATKRLREAQLDAQTIFDLEITPKQEKLLLASYDELKPYFDSDEDEKYSFSARRLIKKLSELSSEKGISPAKIVAAVKAYKEYTEQKHTASTYTRLLSTCLGRTLSEDDVDSLCFILLRSAEKGMSVEEYARMSEACMGKLNTALKKTEILGRNCTIKQFIDAYEAYKAEFALKEAVRKCCEKAEINCPGDALEGARGIIVARRLLRFDKLQPGDERSLERVLDALFGIDKSAAPQLSQLADKLEAFKSKRFSNYYTDNIYSVTYNALKAYRAQLKNRNILNAALSYYKKLDESAGILDLQPFFEPFANGDVKCAFKDLPAAFELSFDKLVLDAYKTILKNDYVGLGAFGALALDSIDEADRRIREINVKRIENLCMSRIDPDDEDYDFLAVDKGARMTTRGLFKNYSSALLKMKRCFILSPSTVSVMFRGKEYFDFDVVIVDEASQLEPVNLLPILMRAKQCVLVGDEFQMPPIVHFKSKNNDVLFDYDKELEIDKDISALSLALENLAFDTAELVCHYRSKTESLIAFSQRAFYPNMRTFPAAVPFKKGIGFEDVYVQNACCKNGVNDAEAEEVVARLKKHFDEYYSEDTGLRKSVGVVAFGEAQLKKIIKLVEQDAELYRKKQNAIDKFDDAPDKIIFFRTIETVQGQETDHLILSLTYGRDANGKAQNRFGELNRDALGKCIFNVAVTRAKDMVTLIHSVKPYELDSESRIGFIVDYIRLVERFAQDGKGQFVSSKLGSGANFVADVAEYIKSLGVDENRIVVNYGVTDGSVKIPIAILNEELNAAVLGIWCELPTGKKYNYLDYNIGYFDSLKERGWRLERLSIQDWYENADAAREALGKIINNVKNRRI